MTPMKAIRLKCEDSICDPLSGGTAVSHIESCIDTDCPLWQYRALTSATKEKLKQERIARMTPDELKAFEAKGEAFRNRMHDSQ